MNLQTSNWYYVQVFQTGIFGVHKTICFAPNKAAALKEVNSWCARHGITPKEINLYLKNYKREAATMVAKGNFIVA
jgi:hypothetical protein